MAELHRLFGDAAFAIALLGGALFAYKVAFAVPWFGVAALILHLFLVPAIVVGAWRI